MVTLQKIEPEEILVTQRLYRRKARSADLDAELRAYRELSSLMAVDANLAVQRFLDFAVELCPAAGSAGLSELIEEESLFRWTAMSGAFAPYVGGTTPRDFSPCGLCLDRQHTVLVEKPARVFGYFNDATPAIFEGLIVPLHDTGKRPIGTLWVTSHAEGERFDPTDARVMEQLAVQLVLAIKLRRKAALHKSLEAAVRDREVLIEEVRHRSKNMLQMTSGLLRVQEHSSRSIEVKTALREAQGRLLALSSVYEALLEGNSGANDVDVGDLIARLAEALRASSAANSEVLIRVDCDPIRLPVNHATTIGLIVNEAVTNSLKYAFPGSAGKINVELRGSDGRCSLVISDDGCGLNAPPREGSLGLRLMRSLARQIEGRFTIDGSSGTSIRVEWTMESGGQAASPLRGAW
jgi:two-component sensor histidine kinase